MDHDDLCSYIHPQQGLSPEVLDRCLSTYVCIRLKCLSNGPLTKYQLEGLSSAVECLGGISICGFYRQSLLSQPLRKIGAKE